MRGEFDALRRVAHLAADVLELHGARLGAAPEGSAEIDELRLALEDLRSRFPYTLETQAETRNGAPAPAGRLGVGA